MCASTKLTTKKVRVPSPSPARRCHSTGYRGRRLSFVQAYDDISRPTSAPPKIFPVAWVPPRPSTSIECPTDVEPDVTVMTTRAPGSRVKRRRRRAGLALTVDAHVVDDNVTVCNNTHVDQSIIDLTASGDINIQKAERKYLRTIFFYELTRCASMTLND